MNNNNNNNNNNNDNNNINVINKLLKLLWYGVGSVPPARSWAGRKPGGFLSVRSIKNEARF